jgi:hypothetical protein
MGRNYSGATGLAQTEVRVVSKTERIRDEARSLWIELYGEPPAAHLDGRQILDLLMRRQMPPGYARLHAASRARDLTWPRKG